MTALSPALVPNRNSASGQSIDWRPVAEPLPARYFRVTFPERGKIILRIGPGDHTVQQWELTPDDIKGLVRDCIPELLK